MSRFDPPSAHGAAVPLIGQHLDPREVLAEPPPRAPDWLTAVYGRVLISSAGPLRSRGLQLPADWTARFAAARIEAVEADADLVEARRHLWPLHEPLLRLDVGAGSCWPAVVVVGQTPGEWGPRRPWLSRSGRWLFRALRRAGYDELTVYGANAVVGRKRQTARLARLAEVLAPAAPAWVACGAMAGEVLRAAGVAHVQVGHPSWHRRFCYSEGEEGLAARLLEAGLPRGPWEAEPPGHTVAAGGAPDLPAPFGGLPRSSSPTNRTDQGGGGGPSVGDGKALLARTLYVTGQVASIREAADRAQAAYQPLCARARAELWEQERREQRERVHREALRVHAETEGGALGVARRTVVAATVEGARQILDRLRAAGERKLLLRPADLERLVRAFHLLSEHRADAYPDAEQIAGAYAELRGALSAELGPEGLAALDAETTR